MESFDQLFKAETKGSLIKTISNLNVDSTPASIKTLLTNILDKVTKNNVTKADIVEFKIQIEDVFENEPMITVSMKQSLARILSSTMKLTLTPFERRTVVGPALKKAKGSIESPNITTEVSTSNDSENNGSEEPVIQRTKTHKK